LLFLFTIEFFPQIRSKVFQPTPVELNEIQFQFGETTMTIACEIFLTYSDEKVNVDKSSVKCGNPKNKTEVTSRKKDIENPNASLAKPIATESPSKPEIVEQCKKDLRARTGFVFTVCVEFTLVRDETIEAKITASKIARRPTKRTIQDANNLVNLTEFQSITNLKPSVKDKIVESLVIDLTKFSRHEAAAEGVRFKRRWRQSTACTDKLARDSRLLNTVFNSVRTTLAPQNASLDGPRRTKRQISNSLTLDMVFVGF
jgi:hypothetical protein